MGQPTPAALIPSVSAAAYSAVLSAAGVPDAAAAVAVASLGSAAGPAVSIRAEPDHLSVGDFGMTVRYDIAFERISASLTSLNSELQRNYDQLRDQVHGWNRFSLVGASVGFALIVLAIVVLTLGHTTPGLVTTAASVIPNSAAALFFVQARRVDNRLDLLTIRLTESREAYALIEIAETIDDAQLRNQLKAEIVRKRLAPVQRAHGSDAA